MSSIAADLHADFLRAMAITGSAMLGAFGLALCVPVYDKQGNRVPSSEVTTKQRIVTSDAIFGAPFMIGLSYLALASSWELWQRGTVEARWFGKTNQTRWFQLLYVSRMILHMPVQSYSYLQSKEHVLHAQMTAHHVLSMISFGGGLVTGRMHFFAVLDGCCEVSTIFLNMLFILKSNTDQSKATLQKMTAGVGFGLWCSFLGFRLALFPTWLALFLSDVIKHPNQTWAKVSNLERYVYPATTTMLLCLSGLWFGSIHRGLVKGLRGAGFLRQSIVFKEH